MPARIQRRRVAGWTKPEGAVYVGRGSRWGNPARVVYRKDTGGWHVEHDRGAGVGTWPTARGARGFAVEAYRAYLDAHPELVAAARAELRGRDLMCWCTVGDPCHADVLLEIANAADSASEGER